MTPRQTDWLFRLATARQRFICGTADTALSRVPHVASSCIVTIPDPADPFEMSFLAAALLELAARWGARRHEAVREACPLSGCAPVALACVGCYWNKAPTNPKRAFLCWVHDFCAELSATHPDRLARRVASLIREKVAEPLDLAEIASEVAAHEATIRRAFKREYHMTPREYHKRVRVEMAEDLLRVAPAEKIDTVGAAVGWKHRKDLCRAVHQVKGCTPGALRARPLTNSN